MTHPKDESPARQVAEKLIQKWELSYDDPTFVQIKDILSLDTLITTALEDAHRRGWNEAVEEAAQKLEHAESAHGNDNGYAHATLVRALAKDGEK